MIHDVSKLNATKIVIGRRGENLANTIEIDVSEWLKEWPSASLHVLVLRPGDTAPYVASTSVSNGVLSWPVTNVDTENAGKGKIEIRATAGVVVKKSVIATIEIEPCILCDEDVDPPELDPALVEQAIAAAERAENAVRCANDLINGNLLINGNFLNVINQGGESTYTSNGYTVDMWKQLVGATDVSVSITSDGLMLTPGTSAQCWLCQHFEYPLEDGAPVTAYVELSNGTIDVVSSNATSTANYKAASGYTIGFENDALSIVVQASGNPVTIRHVALYRGTYTIDTVPTYVPERPAIKQIECRRFYRIVPVLFGSAIGSNGREIITLDPPMRIAPSVARISASGSTDAAVNVTTLRDYYIDVRYTGWGTGFIYLDARL